MNTREKELLINDILSEKENTIDLVTVEQFNEFLNILGVGNIKNDISTLQPGDLYIHPRNNPSLHILWNSISPDDTSNDILEKKMVPVKDLLFPRNMKKIYSTVAMPGYNFATSRGNTLQNLLQRLNSYKINETDYTPGDGVILESGTGVNKIFTHLPAVEKHTHVIHSHNGVTYKTTIQDYNIVNLTYYIVKKRKYSNISDTDMGKYSRMVNVIIKYKWPKNEPAGESYLKQFEVISCNGAGIDNATFKNDITIEYDRTNSITVTYKFDHKIGDFHKGNSEVWLVSAYHTY